MNMQVNKSVQIKFENVYLSELKSVVAIYKNITADFPRDHDPYQKARLTKRFGLPLLIASYGKEVVGFASATLDSSNNQVKINCFSIKGYEGEEIQQPLKEQAIKVFHLRFNNDDNHVKLKLSITALISWLDKCN